MTSFSPGMTGNPDFNPNDRFSGGVLVNNDNQSGISPVTYGPFYVGDCLSIGLICNVSNSASGFQVTVQWWADSGATQLVWSQTYGGVSSAAVYDLIGNPGPYVTVTLQTLDGSQNNIWVTTLIKTQSYPGTVQPLNPNVALDTNQSLAAGQNLTVYSGIITRSLMSYFVGNSGGTSTEIYLAATDATAVETLLLEAFQVDPAGNLLGQGTIQAGVNQLTVTFTNPTPDPVNVTAFAVLL